MKWFVRSWMIATYLLFAGAAYAQAQTAEIEPGKFARAQRIYEQATQLMDAQKYTEACPKLEEVTQLVPSGLGGHETLGQCYEAIGRFGSAWEQYTVAESLAHAKDETQRADDMAARAKAIENKVAKITILVPKELQGVEGLTITHDGKKHEKPLWNTPLPADKGMHVIKVEAPGHVAWSKEASVVADGALLTVEVPMLPVDRKPINAEPMGERPLPERTWQKPLGWTAITLGGASLATTAILSGLAVGKKNASNADGHCQTQNNHCDDVGLSLRQQGVNLANGATATVVIGSVLGLAGVVLVATAPKEKKDERKSAGIGWALEAGPTSIGLRGSW